jgi:hypothetical protein
MANKSLRLRYFTVDEIESTGAKFEDVDSESLICLDKLRAFLGCPIYLLTGGITTGKHVAIEHSQGRAFDWYTSADLLWHKTVGHAVDAGFRGIGYYWNGKKYSWHTDTRRLCTLWMAEKNISAGDWMYSGPKIKAGGLS